MVSFLVPDFPGSRLEFSIRVSLWTGGGHEVSGEETEGQSCLILLVNFTLLDHFLNYKLTGASQQISLIKIEIYL